MLRYHIQVKQFIEYYQDDQDKQKNHNKQKSQDNQDNQDNQVRLEHLWVDFRVTWWASKGPTINAFW